MHRMLTGSTPPEDTTSLRRSEPPGWIRCNEI